MARPEGLAYRADIDGLRALAVLPVLVYHAGLGLPGGFVGVDVFFVISGFLITALLRAEIARGHFSLWRFYGRRARRLLPALCVMLGVTTLAATVLMVPFDLRDFAGSLMATTLFAGNLWFFGQAGYFTEAAELSPLLHTWSLGVEEQFYILFPLLLLLIQSRFAVIGALALASFAAACVAAPEAAFYLPHLRAWELLCGALLAFWGGQVPDRFRAPLVWLGLAGVCVPMLAYSAATPFPGLAALPPCLGALCLIAARPRVLTWTPLVAVGKLSYSLYLWHWPVIALAFYQFGSLSTGQGVACLGLSFGLAYASWAYVEQPVRHSARPVLPWVAAALGTPLLVGLVLWRLDGLPSRMDPELLRLAEPTNFLHDRRDCHGVTPERASAGDVCLRGTPGAPASFALVGDSHADAVSPAIFAAATQLGLAGYQYTTGGFVPLPGVRRLGRAETGDTDALIAFLTARPEVATLILTRYWQHQLTGETYRHSGDVWVESGYDGSGAGDNATATLGGLRRLAEALPDRRIVLLDDVPSGPSLHMRDQLRRAQGGDLSTLGLDVDAATAQRTLYAPLLRALADEVPNLWYQPLFEGLCGAELCPLFAGETLIFRDGDHLSWQGALRLTDPARTLLETTLKERD